MTQYNWSNCPPDIRQQIDHLQDVLRAHLAENLLGIYLHGSLATNCFNPLRSDIDLLAIARQPMTVQSKRALANLLLDASLHPARVEISVLHHADMVPWRYPTPYDFHFSEDSRSGIAHDLDTGAWKDWNAAQRQDEDLAAHITVINHRGICLSGAPISDAFPQIPKADFVNAIIGDVLSPKFGLRSKMDYPVYVVLNACRAFAYLETGNILSKDEGGTWSLQVFPSQYHAVVLTALQAYRADPDDSRLGKEDVASFAAYILGRLECWLQPSLSS